MSRLVAFIAALAVFNSWASDTDDDDDYTPEQCDPLTLENCTEGLLCVKKDDYWAQCVNCTASQFALDCPYFWHQNFTKTAEEACGLTCYGERSSQCLTIECNPDPAKKLKCAKTSEEWAQCVECSDEAFQQDCGFWNEEVLEKAEEVCEMECDSSNIRLL